MSHSQISPSFQAAVDKMIEVLPQARQVTYDPVSSSAMLLANEMCFGVREIPGYQFDQANLVVNFGLDFLGTWLSPSKFASQWAQKRKLRGTDTSNMGRLVQLESNMSYTGSNADDRILIKPSEQGLAIALLYNEVAKTTGGTTVSVQGSLSNPKANKAIGLLAGELVTEQGSSIVLAGSNNTAEQCLVIALNQLLGNYGSTIDFDTSSYQRQGIDRDMNGFVAELRAGTVDAVIFVEDANPVYDHPEGQAIADALAQIGLSVACTGMPNETQAQCNYTCPTSHALEAWSDVMPGRGIYGVVQPTIHRLFDTRSCTRSLLSWCDSLPSVSGNDDLDLVWIRQYAEREVFPKQDQYGTFSAFWDNTLHDGFAYVNADSRELSASVDVTAMAARISRPGNADLELALYEPMGVGAGMHANNPWLQEMPDPVTRVVWDNVVHIPVKWNGRNKFLYLNNLDEDGLLVNLTAGGQAAQLPIVRQFGQMQGTIACALGYGRTVTGKAGAGVGSNCFAMLQTDGDGNLQYYVAEASLSAKVGVDKRFASVQHHHTLGVTGTDSSAGGATINVDEKAVMTLGTGMQGGLTRRTILRHSSAEELPTAAAALKKERAHHQYLNEQTLYPDRSEFYGMGHHWGMSVDLTACIGCGACQVACVAENNVPIVGKKEVNRHHEMTWLRIDRYYYGDVESPSVVYQPMMCQHCDNAPCENVCPVAATTHSSEGINQMAYNRCVGTRYCANNCPYKVRRFNWFDYNTADTFGINENDPFNEKTPFYADNLTRMVLNPDVTVRSRGVIEKCSFCVQRIQEGKLRAKSEMRPLRDGDIKTACQTACPTGAIVFGDQNDGSSELMSRWEDDRNYIALEETNVRSSVGYMMKVQNKREDINREEA